MATPAEPQSSSGSSSLGARERATRFCRRFGLRIPIVSSIAIDPTSSAHIYTGSQFNPSDAFVMKIAP